MRRGTGEFRPFRASDRVASREIVNAGRWSGKNGAGRIACSRVRNRDFETGSAGEGRSGGGGSSAAETRAGARFGARPDRGRIISAGPGIRYPL